jgi:hypothetical protein
MYASPTGVGTITNTFNSAPTQALYKTSAARQNGQTAWSPLVASEGRQVETIQVRRFSDNLTLNFEVPCDFYKWLVDNPNFRTIEECGLGCLTVGGVDAAVPTITMWYAGQSATFVTQQPLVDFFK